jgi:hypothetical protein
MGHPEDDEEHNRGRHLPPGTEDSIDYPGRTAELSQHDQRRKDVERPDGR